jgi:hypothetical protein
MSSRVLKKSASSVLASLRGSTYGKEYDSASSLAEALLDGVFDRPAGFSDGICGLLQGCIPGVSKLFFNSLLEGD